MTAPDPRVRAGSTLAVCSRHVKLPRPREHHAWVLWGGLFAVLCVLLIAQPGRRTVTTAYFPTAQMWWGGEQDVYDEGIWGFLYLPQSVLLFTPFAYLPNPLDEALWRLFGLVLFAFGLRRMAALASSPERRGVLFAMATLLVLPSLWSSARNGQTNLHLAGLLLHAGVDLAERRWWRAAALLWLGMLAKPIALAPILLVGALYRSMRLRLVAGLVAFAALPFLHPDWGYVVRQYGLAFEKLSGAMETVGVMHDDILGALEWQGVDMPLALRTTIRAVAAVGTLLLCWAALRRSGRRHAAFLLTTFAAGYLVLFNARTETNSYVLFVAFPALLAALAWWVRPDRRSAVLLTLACLALGADNYGRWFYGLTVPWIKPLAATLVVLWLAWRARTLSQRPVLAAAGE